MTEDKDTFVVVERGPYFFPYVVSGPFDSIEEAEKSLKEITRSHGAYYSVENWVVC